MNAQALCTALERLEGNLHAYRQVIQAGDWEALSGKLAYSAARKRKMNRMVEARGAVGRDRNPEPSA